MDDYVDGWLKRASVISVIWPSDALALPAHSQPELLDVMLLWTADVTCPNHSKAKNQTPFMENQAKLSDNSIILSFLQHMKQDIFCTIN